jgi:chaperonin GroES
MKDRILTTKHGQFERAAWSGVNESGIVPLCDKVVVLVDMAVEKTKGGIILTEVSSDVQSLSSVTGVLIAIGPLAFMYDSDRIVRWEGERPQPGARVYFEKYAGQEYEGLDGKMYRVMKDRQIGGLQVIPEAIDEKDWNVTASTLTNLPPGIVA